MPTPEQRLRPAPAKRFAGPEHRIELESELAALRREPHDGKDKHRQITVFRRDCSVSCSLRSNPAAASPRIALRVSWSFTYFAARSVW